MENKVKSFNPLTIIGLFWLVFGCIILLATFFVKGTDRVPYSRALITNLIAAAILVVTGLICLIKGRKKAHG